MPFVCADYTLVDYAQIVGAIGSVVAIYFAWQSLQESTKVRQAAIRERRLDRAETRLRAFERIAILVDNLVPYEMSFEVPRTQREIRHVIHGNRLRETLKHTYAMTYEYPPKGESHAAAVMEVDQALEREAVHVESLGLADLDAPLDA